MFGVQGWSIALNGFVSVAETNFSFILNYLVSKSPLYET